MNLNKLKTIIAVSVALALTTCIAVSAQTQAKQNKRPLKQYNVQGQQRNSQINPQQRRMANRAKMIKHRRGFATVQGILLPPGKARIMRISRVLGLTDNQKNQIKDLYTNFRNEVKPEIKDRREALKSIIQARRTNKLNEADIRIAADKVSQADDAILSAEIRFWKSFKQILSPEQLTKLNNQTRKFNQRQGQSGQMKQRMQNRFGQQQRQSAPRAGQRMNTAPGW
ncbi:MAG: Spy/CpxP family protein refolding chaperone [Armatimonadota bacterium]